MNRRYCTAGTTPRNAEIGKAECLAIDFPRPGNWYDADMIVTNAQHETAIVTRRDGKTVVFVRFRAGKLACERLAETMFREQWQETHYPLAETLDRFFAHGQAHGCTQEALKGLEKLKARDRNALTSLF